MNIKEKIFSIREHMEQVRKSELAKPMIMHSIGV